jgi:FkbM family methyltransferase
MKIFYGISASKCINVTDVCLSRKTQENTVFIPACDIKRARIFTDPFRNILKKIFIIHDDTLKEFDDCHEITINLEDNTVETVNIKDIDTRLSIIHSKIHLRYGSLLDELPEQKMAIRCLSGNEKVLEIGSNIGRNSLVIASILQNQHNFVTLESDKSIYEQLIHNRDINNFNFHVENSALSARKLIQRGWNTIPSDILLDGYKPVNIINFEELKNKYKIEFDTLVLDCEGAFYYILMDMPEILNNINTIIMENDYTDIMHKYYVDEVLISNNFYRYYVESGGWEPCFSNFFEIWKKQ